MDKIATSEQPPCSKCESQKWTINNQGNLTCLNCGYVASFGYITYEDEIFYDSENPTKSLSRFSRFGGELNCSLNKSKETNEIEHHIQYFTSCVSLMTSFTQKDIFLEKENFLQCWEAYLGDKKKEGTKIFVYNYFLNEWRGFFSIEQLEDFQRTLKITLKMNESEEVKRVSLANRPSSDDLFYKLLKTLIPQISEEQYEICQVRLEDIRNSVNCNRTTFVCVATYDLLLNYFLLQKVEIKKIVNTAHQIFDVKGTVLKEATVKRVYQQLTRKQTKLPSIYTI